MPRAECMVPGAVPCATCLVLCHVLGAVPGVEHCAWHPSLRLTVTRPAYAQHPVTGTAPSTRYPARHPAPGTRHGTRHNAPSTRHPIYAGLTQGNTGDASGQHQLHCGQEIRESGHHGGESIAGSRTITSEHRATPARPQSGVYGVTGIVFVAVWPVVVVTVTLAITVPLGFG